MIDTLRPSFFICSNSYAIWVWGGNRVGPRLEGASGVASSAAGSHLAISLRSLASWSRELQRRQRELPSGQSPQFSPSALPFGHMPGCCPKRNQPEPQGTRDRREDQLHLWERDPWPKFLAKLSDVEEACGRGKNLFSPIVCSIPSLPPSPRQKK